MKKLLANPVLYAILLGLSFFMASKDHYAAAILIAALALGLALRFLQNNAAARLLEETKHRVSVEDTTKAAREAIIDLHLHAPDRAYFLACIDQTDSQKAFARIVEEAKTVATKHPLGMNI